MNRLIEYRVNAALAPQDVAALLKHTDWAAERGANGIATMLRGGVVHVSAHKGGEVIGFARAFGDGLYRAVIEDVVVHPTHRGAGVGRSLVALLLEQLADVEEVVLFCVPAREAFYGAHGFERHGVTAMRRRT